MAASDFAFERLAKEGHRSSYAKRAFITFWGTAVNRKEGVAAVLARHIDLADRRGRRVNFQDMASSDVTAAESFVCFECTEGYGKVRPAFLR